MFNLLEFMAATRAHETGYKAPSGNHLDGHYGLYGIEVKGDRAYGAYQIMGRNWEPWAAEAGIPGASKFSPAAQDRVAAFHMTKYFNKYQNWDLVMVAWYAGPGAANTLVDRGYTGPEVIISDQIRKYVYAVRGWLVKAKEQGYGAGPKPPFDPILPVAPEQQPNRTIVEAPPLPQAVDMYGGLQLRTTLRSESATMLDSWLDALSNQIAGGSRLNYLDFDEEPEEEEELSPIRREMVDIVNAGRPTPGVTEGIIE